MLGLGEAWNLTWPDYLEPSLTKVRELQRCGMPYTAPVSQYVTYVFGQNSPNIVVLGPVPSTRSASSPLLEIDCA